MTRVKYLILGAGPSALSFAHTLLRQGEQSFLVLEKESVAGGLCRSQIVDGSPWTSAEVTSWMSATRRSST